MIPGGTIGAALGRAAKALKAEGFDEPRRRARSLVAAALDLPAANVFAHPQRSLSAADVDKIAAFLARILAHEPLSRILGEREFWGLRFRLCAETLDPRPESETVVAAVLKHVARCDRALRLLDLGTGSGCLLLALLSELPEAIGLGVDIAPGAAQTAHHNAQALGLSDRARFLAGDWGAAVNAQFDLVVANPPYVATAALATLPPEVASHDPRRALDGGADGLAAYRALAGELPRLLAPGGIFAAEIGQGQAEAVRKIITGAGLVVRQIVPDLAGIPRCLVAEQPAQERGVLSENGSQKMIGMPHGPV